MSEKKYEEILEKMDKQVADMIYKISSIVRSALSHRNVALVKELENIFHQEEPSESAIEVHSKVSYTYFNLSQIIEIFKLANTLSIITATMEKYFSITCNILQMNKVPTSEFCTLLVNLNKKIINSLRIFIMISAVDTQVILQSAELFVGCLFKNIYDFDFTSTNETFHQVLATLLLHLKEVPMLQKIVLKELQNQIKSISELLTKNPGIKLQDTHFEVLNLLLLLLRENLQNSTTALDFFKEQKLQQTLLVLQEGLRREHYTLLVDLIDNILYI